ncbi:hypothetical protein LRY65_02640 [Candidatus Woesebacteria bacterium]|nr:hypothetical protein [Candidatus Woesebacteria bacterium]MCD8546721.1 hypothetical protein [Candidatus Woesebacteria bacterium]
MRKPGQEWQPQNYEVGPRQPLLAEDKTSALLVYVLRNSGESVSGDESEKLFKIVAASNGEVFPQRILEMVFSNISFSEDNTEFSEIGYRFSKVEDSDMWEVTASQMFGQSNENVPDKINDYIEENSNYRPTSRELSTRLESMLDEWLSLNTPSQREKLEKLTLLSKYLHANSWVEKYSIVAAQSSPLFVDWALLGGERGDKELMAKLEEKDLTVEEIDKQIIAILRNLLPPGYTIAKE